MKRRAGYSVALTMAGLIGLVAGTFVQATWAGRTGSATGRPAPVNEPIGAQTRPEPAMTKAEELFRTGRFTESDAECMAVLSGRADDYGATLLRGRIALLSNRLDDAEQWLGRARRLRAENTETGALLAETYYRRDQFDQAATVLRTMGQEGRARQLESFHGQIPYQLDSAANETRVRFLYTDPLPLIAVRVNQSEEVNFLIDTGGGEVIVDTDFAKRVKAEIFGENMGVFGGGKQAAVQFARVHSITLGDFQIRNVPVRVMPTPFSDAANGKRVDGVIGTVLLYHFLATLDYPKGELVLRKRTAENLRELNAGARNDAARNDAAQNAGPISLPFWMAGDHFMVTWGTAGKSKPVLLFVDTGSAGSGFIGTKSLLEEAGIDPSKGAEQEGMGGGGMMKYTVFTVPELSLGPAQERDVSGSYGEFPTALEYGQGFRIAGIISHSFFRPYAVTFDFDGMRIVLNGAQSTDAGDERFTAMAKTVVDDVNSSNYEALVANFDKNMLTGFPLEKVKAFFDGLKSQQGKIQRLEAARVVSATEALFVIHFEHGDLDMKIMLDQDHKLSGLGFFPVEQESPKRPAAEARVNKTPLSLPFRGRWLVMNGGDTRELNAHHDAPNQVAAFDFVGVGADGKEFANNGQHNEDYYAFAREVLAPGDGTVRVVISGVPDNAVGSLNPYSALGNAVFIDHGDGEVSVLAHLKLGSTRVRVGDRVKAGDVLALCGSSGNSTKPHLHYHLQDSLVIQDGKGIKVDFQSVGVVHGDGIEQKEHYSPVKGDTIVH